jgi:hypothetical protein
MNTELIKFFGVSVKAGILVDPIELNKQAMAVGYVVHPEACNDSTLKFINSLHINYNATFYKTWMDVMDRSEMELFANHMMYYMFKDKDGILDAIGIKDEPVVSGYDIDYKSYKVIRPCTFKELYDKCYDIICSGIAMKTSTLEPICSYIMEYQDHMDNVNIDVEAVKNKEAQIILCYGLGKFPKDNFSLLRLLIYHRTGNTMLIKSPEVINDIKNGDNQLIPDFDLWNCLTEEQLISLSEIFYRFKPIFLAFRHVSAENKKIINKIRRYAKQYHAPFIAGYWESILSEKHDVMGINIRIDELSNFKLVQLINAAYEKIKTITAETDIPSLYKIRNGKLFVKEGVKKTEKDQSDYLYYLYIISHLFANKLIANLSTKACTVKYPKGLNLTCPTSEKNFVDDVPVGSYFNMVNNGYIGIYWDYTSGTRDFDLSAISQNGWKIGWDSYKNMDGLVHSGDIIYPDPDATEILKCRNTCEDCTIFVNRYNGSQGSWFKLFYGEDRDDSNVDNRRMFDNKDVLFNTKMTSDKKEKMIGVILDNKMYITDYDISDCEVSGSARNELNKLLLDGLRNKMNSMLNLKSILCKAGFAEWNDSMEHGPELDLTDLKKDTLIKLFS